MRNWQRGNDFIIGKEDMINRIPYMSWELDGIYITQSSLQTIRKAKYFIDADLTMKWIDLQNFFNNETNIWKSL